MYFLSIGMNMSFINFILKAFQQHTINTVVGFIFASLMLYLGLSQDSVRNSIMRFFTSPENFIDILYIFFLISLTPIFLEIYYSFTRKRLGEKFSDKIYEGIPNLALGQIAYKWEKIANAGANSRHGRNDVGERLKAAMKQGFLVGSEEEISKENFKKWICSQTVDIPKS